MDPGQHVVKLMLQQDRKRPPIRIVGISDSSGGVSSNSGLPLGDILAWKTSGNSLRSYGGGEDIAQHPSTLSMVQATAKRGDIVLDGTPVDLQTGGAGLECCRYATLHGIHVILANKAPLVLAYEELTQNAALEPKSWIEFSATVCGGLPVVNVGRRDLCCGRIDNVQGILNSTSNYILSRMAAGESAATALISAQQRGIAEADPSLDLVGYDTANKLVIICNSVLRIPARLADVNLTGITEITVDDVATASSVDEVYRLIATAERCKAGQEGAVTSPDRDGGSYVLSVKPVRVPKSSFFGICADTDMSVVFKSDEFETISMKTDEKGVFPTASAMLRDCFSIVRRGSL